MLTEQDLIALSTMMDEKLNPIKEQLDILQEGMNEVRGTTNEISAWCEQASEHIQVPYMKKAQ